MTQRPVADYRDVTYEYLRACAKKGAIYVELMSSPDHAAEAGMSYQDHVDGIVVPHNNPQLKLAICLQQQFRHQTTSRREQD